MKILKSLAGKPFLREFAEWLYHNQYYDEDEIAHLLCRKWEDAFPRSIIGDDLLVDIGAFLYNMAEFSVEKVYGKEWWMAGTHRIRIVAEPSYEDRSYVYVLELKTKTVLAEGFGEKTWNCNPEIIEENLKDLVSQLKKSRNLLGVRVIVE